MEDKISQDHPDRRGYGKATLADVAKVAGVSPITVSRVIRVPNLVRDATRRRVIEAIDEVGYIPNHVAGSLASSETKTIAAIVPTLGNSIFTEMLHGMVDVLRPANYQLILGNSDFVPTEEENLITAFLGRQVDGIVLTGCKHTRRARDMLRRAKIPVVETWSLPQEVIMASVGFSNYDAAYAMVEHLHQKGYKEIAFVSAPTENNDRAYERHRGYYTALRDLGLRYTPESVLTSSFGLSHGAWALGQILDVRPRADAIFFANDVLAAGAILECQRRGLKVPGDIAIAGFDDIEIASQMVPALTTVRVHRYEVGAAAAQFILDELEGNGVPSRRVDLGFEVVQRQST